MSKLVVSEGEVDFEWHRTHNICTIKPLHDVKDVASCSAKIEFDQGHFQLPDSAMT